MGQTGTMDGPQNVPAPNVLALPQAPDAIELRHLRAFVAVAPVLAGGVPALRVTPEISSPATVLFLHGGGHVAGSAFGYRHLAAAIALAARAPALVIDYRLAPEHPYPAAVQDAVNAYLWLRDTGGDQARIVVAGDSSAGGLVMSVLLALRERGLE